MQGWQSSAVERKRTSEKTPTVNYQIGTNHLRKTWNPTAERAVSRSKQQKTILNTVEGVR